MTELPPKIDPAFDRWASGVLKDACGAFSERIAELKTPAKREDASTDLHEQMICDLRDLARSPSNSAAHAIASQIDALKSLTYGRKSVHAWNAEGLVLAFLPVLALVDALDPEQRARRAPWEEEIARNAAQELMRDFDRNLAWREAAAVPHYEDGITGCLRIDRRFAGKPERPQWVSEPFIQRGVLTLISSLPGRGKSGLMLNWAIDIARHWDRINYGPGEPLMSLDPVGGRLGRMAGPVLFVSVEDGAAEIHRRLDAIEPDRKARENLPLYVISADEMSDLTLVSKSRGGFSETGLLAELKARLDDIRGGVDNPAVVMIDPAQSLVNDEIDAGEVKFAMERLAAFARKENVAVVALCHTPKAGAVDEETVVRYGPRGSGAWVGRARMSLLLFRPNDAKEVAKITQCRLSDVLCLETHKSNWDLPDDLRRRYLVRRGMRIEDVTHKVQTARAGGNPKAQLLALVGAVAEAAKAGNPFSRTGNTGIYAKRKVLPAILGSLSRRLLEELCGQALDAGHLDLRDRKLYPGDVPVPEAAAGMGSENEAKSETSSSRSRRSGTSREGKKSKKNS